MRILLVDDHVLFREGLVSLLSREPDLEIVGEAGSVCEAIESARRLKPDLILMDFSLPDGTGLEAAVTILADRPETNIVFLTVHEEDDGLFRVLRAGAKGYLLKNVPVSRLLSYLRGIERGEAAIAPSMVSRILSEFFRLGAKPESRGDAFNELTLRELEVLQELSTGATNREIADRLVITENTVKNHVRSILAKLNLRNRREAANFARQRGMTKV